MALLDFGKRAQELHAKAERNRVIVPKQFRVEFLRKDTELKFPVLETEYRQELLKSKLWKDEALLPPVVYRKPSTEHPPAELPGTTSQTPSPRTTPAIPSTQRSSPTQSGWA